MPVRNADIFLAEAINSILAQTYKNIELIIINDASVDNTSKILASLKDKRVRVYENKKQLGVTKSANIAISKARGQYIARMDGDDISIPVRIVEQLAFLKKHKRVVAVGTQCELIDSRGSKIGDKLFPESDQKVRRMIFSSVPLQQPSIMVDTSRLPENFIWYDENYSSAEELELLFKLFKYGEVCNLEQVLLKYRIHAGNTSLKNPKKTFYLTLKTRLTAISKYNYRPTIYGIFVTALQTLIVSVIPEKLIYPLYSIVRGTSKFSVKIRFDANLNSEKNIRLAKV